MAKRKIHLELCPISNLRTGVIESVSNHPIRHYFDSGLELSVNTDDPKMFNNTLVDEYEVLSNTFGFTMDELQSVLKMTVDAAWCSEEKQRELLLRIGG